MITFIKDLLPVNPAYNNSIIQFSSSVVSGATKAVITVENKSFTCVPINGVFTFNFKELVKSLINSNRFDDSLVPNLNSGNNVISDPSIIKQLQVNIRIQNFTISEETNRTYTFIRGVEQLVGYNKLVNIDADVKVLLPSTNYLDYYFTFFEGFPFDIAIQGIKENDTFYLKNVTLNSLSPLYESQDNDIKRFYFSDGANNTTDTNILLMSSVLNKLELYVNDVFKANLYVTKIESDCGVYLKWLNTKGSYSYWKFESIFKRSISPKTIDDFSGNYDNLQNLLADQHIFGKTANETWVLTTTYDSHELEYLQDLNYSPSVQMYLHQHPFKQQGLFDFVGVKVNDASFGKDNKLNKGKMSVTIFLPAINTITQ